MRGAVRRSVLALAGLVLFGSTWPALADWAGFRDYVAIAEVRVEEESIRVEIRLRENGLPRLRALLGLAAEAPVSEIAGQILRMVADRSAIPEVRPIAVWRVDSSNNGGRGAEPYYQAEMTVPLRSRPRVLNLIPPDRADKELGLVVLHRGVPVADPAPLSKPARLQLDWSDPWRSRFDDAEHVRRHTEPRSFVYVEPYEVRHELLLKLKDLLPELDFVPVNPHRIQGEERERLKQAIGDLLLHRNPLRLDGLAAIPRLDRVEFVRYRREGVEIVPGGEPLDSATAVVGAILVYLTKRPAAEVELSWELFAAGESSRSVSLQLDDEIFDADVTRRDPVFRWSREEALGISPTQDALPTTIGSTEATSAPESLLLRVSGIVLAAAVAWRWRRSRLLPPGAGAQLSLTLAVAGCVVFYPEIARFSAHAGSAVLVGHGEEVMKAELQALLHNVYRAFELPEEEAAYDRLAMSLSGDVLEDVYLHQRRTLLQRGKGLGGDGRVQRVEVLSSDIESVDPESGRVSVAARWIAHGSVSHWGHSHPRDTLYAARLALSRAEDGRLKITDLEFTEERGTDPGM
ncbi:hypothetical protein [Methylocaldum szegediense]|uniref:Uncharacterized protein n=1 Tax=Methylocaldum szegediense TaxID=73780 RepID=A0ABN8WX76_9GAMM|nr:hypothetical protein [Methylocaldum szegediense]CAI8735294.1 conserved protein of unknown function [Methylocaldum szegediense]